jgi:hypothetical protein
LLIVSKLLQGERLPQRTCLEDEYSLVADTPKVAD